MTGVRSMLALWQTRIQLRAARKGIPGRVELSLDEKLEAMIAAIEQLEATVREIERRLQ